MARWFRARLAGLDGPVRDNGGGWEAGFPTAIFCCAARETCAPPDMRGGAHVALQ